MPNRVIKERATSSPSLNRLSDAAERLFWRLYLKADDYGRFEADPCVLVAECHPLKIRERGIVDRVARAYAELEAGPDPIVRSYEVNGRRYGYFTGWDNKPRAEKSKYPDPPTSASTGDPMHADARNGEQSPAPAPVTETVTETEGRESRADAPRPRRGKSRKVPWPDGFALTDDMRAYATRRGYDAEVLFEDFRVKSHARGYVYVDWVAAWQAWVRDEGKYGRSKAQATSGPAQAREALGRRACERFGMTWQPSYARVDREVWADLMARYKHDAAPPTAEIRAALERNLSSQRCGP